MKQPMKSAMKKKQPMIQDDKATEDKKETSNDKKEKDDEKRDEKTDSETDGKEYTLLDKIISDQTILENVINDETTDPGIVSNLVDLKQEIENAPISETCDNNVDDNADGMIATVSDEGCAPTTTNTNAIITDTSTNSDTNTNTTDANTNSDTNTNTTDANTNTILPILLTLIQIVYQYH